MSNEVDPGQILYRALLKKIWISIGADGVPAVGIAAFRPKNPGEAISVDIAELTTVSNSLKKFKPETGLAAFLCQVAQDVGCQVLQEVDQIQPDNIAHAHVYLPADSDELEAAIATIADACTILVEYDRKRKSHLEK